MSMSRNGVKTESEYQSENFLVEGETIQCCTHTGYLQKKDILNQN